MHALDTRIKATITSTMYDMTRVNANGYFDEEDNEESRYEKRKAMSLQRTLDYKNNDYAHAGALPDEAPEQAPQYLIDYIDYYRTKTILIIIERNVDIILAHKEMERDGMLQDVNPS